MDSVEKILVGMFVSMVLLISLAMVLDYSLDYRKMTIESTKNRTLIVYDDRIVILPEDERFNDSGLVMFL